jgi:hypothetical protein
MDAGPRRAQYRDRCSSIRQFRRHQGRSCLSPFACALYLTSIWQGFLRRVHRWPILQADDAQPETKTTTLPPSPIGPRKRASSLTVPPLVSSSSIRAKRRTSDAMLAFATVSAHSTSGTVSLPPRAAEASLGTFRSRGSAPPSSPQTVRARHASATPASLFEITQTLGPPPPVRPRLSRSPSSPAIKTQTQTNSGTPAPAPVLASQPLAYPPALVPLLDGEHHADELCCQFEVGWPTLERWLVVVGGGSGDGDFSNVLIIYR